jgi:hypothetical protein
MSLDDEQIAWVVGVLERMRRGEKEALAGQCTTNPLTPPERTDNKYLDHRVTCNEQPLARARQISAPDLGQQVAAVFGVFDGQSVGFFIVDFV